MKIPYVTLGASFNASKEEYIESLRQLIDEGHFILGEVVEAFEAEFADLCGVSHAISVNSGFDALNLALKALGVGAGNEVITAPNSFVASAGAIVVTGAQPVFADVAPDRNLDIESVLQKVTSRTRAIMPVHLTGLPFDVGRLKGLLNSREIFIIEDCAQAIGSTLGGVSVGAFGDVGCFSFHPLKNLGAIGDGGCIVTNSQPVAERLKRLRNHGLKDRNTAVEWGRNSRLDAVQAAWLRIRLRALPDLLARRCAIAQRYREGLSGAKGIQLPIVVPEAVHSWHAFVIQTENRDHLQRYLAERGIETLVHYPVPLHLQPAAALSGCADGSHPVCEAQAMRILSFPIRETLTDSEVDFVIDAVATWSSL